MDSSNVAYRSHLVNHLPALARDSDVSERLRFLMSPLLALVLLDLESARSLLTAGSRDRTGMGAPAASRPVLTIAATRRSFAAPSAAAWAPYSRASS